jgi:uncharacterized protein YicC (UPF0701 family)
MKNTFKKGLILGGLLAVGGAIGFAMTREGKELGDDLQKDLKSLAKHLKKALHNVEDVTKEKYDALVERIVDEYVKEKKHAIDAKDHLLKALKENWVEMEAEYNADHKE